MSMILDVNISWPSMCLGSFCHVACTFLDSTDPDFENVVHKPRKPFNWLVV